MPAGPADIGIQSSNAAMLQSIEYEISLSEAIRTGPVGGFLKGNAFDPQISGSLTFLGTSEIDLGVAASGITGIAAGVTVFNEKTVTEVQDNYNETQLSFDNAPGAETGPAA